MWRSIGVVVLGLLAGGIVVGLVESINTILGYAPSEEVMDDPAKLLEFVDQLPATACFVVLLAWFLGALAGASFPMWLSHEVKYSWIVVAILLAAGISQMTLLPHPGWFWVPGILVYPAGGWLGINLLPEPDDSPDFTPTMENS